MNSITAYHQRTKHSLQTGYARGPETIDWDDQPIAFRYFEGCSHIKLPKPGRHLDITWSQLHVKEIKPAELNLDNLSLLLELSFGLSAWKQVGPDRWAVRNNPSSGNLHPSEAYVINSVADLLPAGVYHYVSHDHLLEQRCQFENVISSDQILIGLSSIHWREAWKYGERAYRYCQLDTGHALAAINYAAAILGWRVELLTNLSDDQTAQLLGLDRDDFIDKEYETPEWLCRIHYKQDLAEINLNDIFEQALQAQWQGKAKSLKAYHMFNWPEIDVVSQAARKAAGDELQQLVSWQTSSAVRETDCNQLATTLIRQRRSAQRFIAKQKPMSQAAFFTILSALGTENTTAVGVWPWQPAVHLCVFVHDVEGVEAGLYCLPRSQDGLISLKQQLNPEFLWQAVSAYPNLYLLHPANVRQLAKQLSCHQAIASDGVFSVAMLAEFNRTISQKDWYYRRLFWECGLLGQILYLEAEASTFRGTGIGCFFDDDVHTILSIKTNEFQSLYHFTVGEPFEDARIQSFPAYAHLNDG